MSLLDPDREHYLGDGLYASFDGYQIRLRAPREHGDHWVALEPEVLLKFTKYVHELRVAVDAARRDELARQAGT